jgi:hypothetical protein
MFRAGWYPFVEGWPLAEPGVFVDTGSGLSSDRIDEIFITVESFNSGFNQ